MRARLLMILPAEGLSPDTDPPFAPTILVEDGAIGLFTTDFTRQLDFASLEEITETDIRAALHLNKAVFVYLSPVRELPDDDLNSGSMLVWRQRWWHEVFTRLHHEKAIPGTLTLKAS